MSNRVKELVMNDIHLEEGPHTITRGDVKILKNVNNIYLWIVVRKDSSDKTIVLLNWQNVSLTLVFFLGDNTVKL